MNIQTELETIIIKAIVERFKFITRNEISEQELERIAQATALDIKDNITKEL